MLGWPTQPWIWVWSDQPANSPSHHQGEFSSTVPASLSTTATGNKDQGQLTSTHATYGQVSILEPWCCQGHTDLSVLHCLPGGWCHLVLGYRQGPCLGPEPRFVLTSMAPITMEDSKHRAAELAPPLTGFTLAKTGLPRESSPCTTPAQHSRADHVSRGGGEPALKVGKLKNYLTICRVVAWARESPLSPLTTYSRQESWSRGHKSGRADPDPHQLQHLREQTLHLNRQHNRVDPVDGVAGDLVQNMHVGDLVPPLTCHMVEWVKERCAPTSHTPWSLCQVKELALRSWRMVLKILWQLWGSFVV